MAGTYRSSGSNIVTKLTSALGVKQKERKRKRHMQEDTAEYQKRVKIAGQETRRTTTHKGKIAKAVETHRKNTKVKTAEGVGRARVNTETRVGKVKVETAKKLKQVRAKPKGKPNATPSKKPQGKPATPKRRKVSKENKW